MIDIETQHMIQAVALRQVRPDDPQIRGFFSSVKKGLKAAARAGGGIVKVGAPVAGGIVGAVYGGPVGAMVGSKVGGVVGNAGGGLLSKAGAVPPARPRMAPPAVPGGSGKPAPRIKPPSGLAKKPAPRIKPPSGAGGVASSPKAGAGPKNEGLSTGAKIGIGVAALAVLGGGAAFALTRKKGKR